MIEVRASVALPCVVIDKSYLQGASALRICELSESNVLVMTDALLYELMSKSQAARAKAFCKFPRTDRPFELSRGAGFLMREELRTGRALGQPSKHMRVIDHSSTSSFRDPDYALTEVHKIEMERKRIEIEQDVDAFISYGRTIEALFPDLKKPSAKKCRVQASRDAQERLRLDGDFMITRLRFILARATGVASGAADAADRSWFSYKWLQLQFYYALDFWARYPEGLGAHGGPKFSERIRHDVLDAMYLVVGLQEGAFATKEKKLQECWKALYPELALITS